MEAPREDVHNQAFNVGADDLNHQIRDLAEIAAKTVPGCEVRILAQAGADQRTYKTSFAKFAGVFPAFKFEWNAERGARDLHDAFASIGLTRDDYEDRRFTRLKWIRHLLETRALDESLRWSAAGVGAAAS